MRLMRVRLTVFRLLLVVAVAAIVSYVVTDRARSSTKARVAYCLEAADWHARVGAEYRRNAQGNVHQLRTAAWHEHMRRTFERAAAEGGATVPATAPFPPEDWEPPTP